MIELPELMNSIRSTFLFIFFSTTLANTARSTGSGCGEKESTCRSLATSSNGTGGVYILGVHERRMLAFYSFLVGAKRAEKLLGGF